MAVPLIKRVEKTCLQSLEGVLFMLLYCYLILKYLGNHIDSPSLLSMIKLNVHSYI